MSLTLDALSTTVAGTTPDLLRWVHTQLDAGHTPEVLQRSLVQTGWQPDIGQAALAAVLQWRNPNSALHAGTAPALPAHTARAMPRPALGDQASHLDGGDRSVQVLMTVEHPRVVLLGNVLSPEECDTLIAEARPAMARSRTVAVQTGGEEINPDRTSDGMFFVRGQTPTVRRVEARIAQLLQWPVNHGEGLQILNYRPGAEYKPHHDYFDPQESGSAKLLQRGGQRLATLVMYLNDVTAGGCTYFPETGLRIQPRRGHAVFFSYPRPEAHTLTLHGGDPVLAGEKWIATKWLREGEFQ